MEIAINPQRTDWPGLMRRASIEDNARQTRTTVAEIIAAVRTHGDTALRDLERRFTGAKSGDLIVSAGERSESMAKIPHCLADAIDTAAANIMAFHRAQLPREIEVVTSPGVRCTQKAIPIERVGLYIPGGNSPLFSTVLMLAIPAKVAGCRDIVLCTPSDASGHIHPAIIYAAEKAGVNTIYKIGGAQAIAAMAFGTESVRKVDKIFGPGNRYVTEAKQQVAADGIAIDMPAGPSEVMIIADDAASPEFVAADFLSQAEHGPDSQSILLTTSRQLLDSVPEAIARLMANLPRHDFIERSLSQSRIILLPDDSQIMEFANEYAPEHLIINTANAGKLALKVRNAGSVFLGQYSPESAGDYASGTNHTLPTSGHARSFSGVNTDSFLKKITFQELSPEGVMTIGPTVATMAEAENLHAHKLAMTLRLNSLKQ